MTPAFTARRRAEEFNELVEDTSTAGLAALADTRYADLGGALATLREAPPVLPRPEFAADLRSRLMIAAQTALTPGTATLPQDRSTAPRHASRDRKVAALLGGFAIVTASTSMAVAAQSALPGDTLYPLKRAIENAHAGVESGDGKGTTLLANAHSRLKEVDELSRAGSHDPQVISQTLQDFTDQATQASAILLGDYRSSGHVSSLQQLRTFTADSMAILDQLKTVVPDQARATLIQATQVLQQIDQQALAACPGCNLTSLSPLLTSSRTPDVLAHLVDPAQQHAKPVITHRHHTTKKKHGGSTPSSNASPSSGPAPATTVPGSTSPPAGTTTKPPSSTPDPLQTIKKHLHDATTSNPDTGGTGGIGGILSGADTAVTGLLHGGVK